MRSQANFVCRRKSVRLCMAWMPFFRSILIWNVLFGNVTFFFRLRKIYYWSISAPFEIAIGSELWNDSSCVDMKYNVFIAEEVLRSPIETPAFLVSKSFNWMPADVKRLDDSMSIRDGMQWNRSVDTRNFRKIPRTIFSLQKWHCLAVIHLYQTCIATGFSENCCTLNSFT